MAWATAYGARTILESITYNKSYDINRIEGNLLLSFNDLPKKLNLYNKEWNIIRDYLIKLEKN